MIQVLIETNWNSKFSESMNYILKYPAKKDLSETKFVDNVANLHLTEES